MSTGGGNSPVLLVERSPASAVVSLNRPERRNAIDRELADALESAFDELASDTGVRAVVLTGMGSSFCAGADLADARPSDARSVLLGTTRRLTEAIDRFAKPVIAAVNGPAFGGGCELALACDIRIAATDASFCLPEVRIGSIPGSGGTQRLVAAVGSSVAGKMLLTGAPLEAEEALRVGLVSDLYPPGTLRAAALELVARVASNAPLSLLATKQALRASHSESGLALERALWALLATTTDRAEGRLAFRERRPPEFHGE